MNSTLAVAKPRIAVPVIALFLYAVASGYLMSIIPLALPQYGLESSLASWLASAFYAGLLVGAMMMEPMVNRIGHRVAFIASLGVFIFTIAVLIALPHAAVWLAARFLAGIAVAGVFVTVESWLLHGDEAGRAKRLGLYMGSLYGGAALGQLGIGIIGIEGMLPVATILGLLLLAVVSLMFGESDQPDAGHSDSLSLKQISKLNQAALIGCIVSGLTLGAIYGLMPLELSNRGIAREEVGSLMALIILGGMAVQPMVPWLSKYLGRTLLMAMFSLLGVGALAMTFLQSDIATLAVNLFLLGMATFALYPIAINLACDKLDTRYIVSATQVMLFSYSIGSVLGPVIADRSMGQNHGLMSYLFLSLLATCIYMLLMSVKARREVMMS
ncbi:MFS transporter [Vibrio agarivorans]|uniref:MFS transporter n=1 Tax=Vibrio agarivorans TaxID=153622 RepID=A0ABT7Y3W0_9VIBR|nr:MFS transporter [Vibrio agarivorans]MDN2482737.1 MFS transporter [Vibrio agarivorans]